MTYWILSIKDYGQGIDPQHLPQPTEAFYRVDKSRQRSTGGYGLGLYLCRVIAEAHGGELNIASEPGKGTEITVTLPLQPA
ncbi:MAG: ATP-binding protein [Pseudomonadota bacterium]